MKQFMDFLNKYGVIGLAIAFVMGAAVSKLVSAPCGRFDNANHRCLDPWW